MAFARRLIRALDASVLRDNMNAWIGIIGTVVGAIIGGGIALLNAHVQLRRQIQRDRQKLILSKLEELHEVLASFRKAYRATFLEELSSAHDVTLPVTCSPK